MPGPETDNPATSPDQNGNPHSITPALEAEMKSWDQRLLESNWGETVKTLASWGQNVPAYTSPSGDTDFENKVNQIIQYYVVYYEAEFGPGWSQTSDAYSLNRDDKLTTSSGPDAAQGADPVDLFNGGFVYAATDFRIDGAGINFAFTRTHSQLCAYRGPLGFNWDHSCNLWLRVPGDGTILERSTGALREETFQKHEQHGYWFPVNGRRGVILEEGGSFCTAYPTE